MQDRVTWVDYLLAALTGVVMAGVLLLFSSGLIDPSLWEDATIVAGLRPPRTMVPGLWRLVPGVMTPLLGAVSGGVLATLLYLVLRYAFMMLVRPNAEHPDWRRYIAPFLSAAGAMLAVASDPVWRACQIFTPTVFKLVCVAFFSYMFLAWTHRGGWWRLYPVLFLMGVFSSESVFGFLLPIVFIILNVLIFRAVIDGEYDPLVALRSGRRLPKWRMFFSFAAGLVLGMRLNLSVFFARGGAAQYGWSRSDGWLHYAADFLREFVASGSPLEWVFYVGLVLLPIILAVAIFPRLAVDANEPIDFRPGLLMLLVGGIAYMQVSPVPTLWFWRWFALGGFVGDPFMLGMSGVFSAAVFTLAAGSFTFGLYGFWTEMRTKPYLLLYLSPVIVVFVALVFSAVNLSKPGVARAQRIVEDGVREVVREAGDATFIFTDGTLDAAIELEAARQGKTLHPLNMMGSAMGRDAALARRFLTNPDDLEAVSQGVPVLLRIWRDERTNGLDRAAIQLGFELWQRSRQPLPEHSGLVARTKGLTREASEAGRKAAAELAERIIAAETAGDAAFGSKALRRALANLSWRISRFARLRDDSDLAERLDVLNSTLKQMLRQVEYERMRTFMQFTPREALQIALKRADFLEARRSAQVILKYDEDDAEANFALGMAYLTERAYKESALYLRRCLKARPDEPAVLNNLSIVCRKLRKYDEALALARRAAELRSDLKEIKQTLSDAEKRTP